MNTHMKNRLLIATDGACSGNGRELSPGGFGAVLLFGEHKKEIFGGSPNTTNNIMEIKACIEALKSIKKPNIPTTVYSDSAYVVNCINQKWYMGWRRNGWLNSKKEPVENRELWEELLKLYEKFLDIEFIKVKGHLNLDNKSAIKKWLDKLNSGQSGKKARNISMPEYIQAINLNNLADTLANKGMAEFLSSAF